jgi:hypothetical protein
MVLLAIALGLEDVPKDTAKLILNLDRLLNPSGTIKLA